MTTLPTFNQSPTNFPLGRLLRQFTIIYPILNEQAHDTTTNEFSTLQDDISSIAGIRRLHCTIGEPIPTRAVTLSSPIIRQTNLYLHLPHVMFCLRNRKLISYIATPAGTQPFMILVLPYSLIVWIFLE